MEKEMKRHCLLLLILGLAVNQVKTASYSGASASSGAAEESRQRGVIRTYVTQDPAPEILINPVDPYVLMGNYDDFSNYINRHLYDAQGILKEFESFSTKNKRKGRLNTYFLNSFLNVYRDMNEDNVRNKRKEVFPLATLELLIYEGLDPFMETPAYEDDSWVRHHLKEKCQKELGHQNIDEPSIEYQEYGRDMAFRNEGASYYEKHKNDSSCPRRTKETSFYNQLLVNPGRYKEAIDFLTPIKEDRERSRIAEQQRAERELLERQQRAEAQRVEQLRVAEEQRVQEVQRKQQEAERIKAEKVAKAREAEDKRAATLAATRARTAKPVVQKTPAVPAVAQSGAKKPAYVPPAFAPKLPSQLAKQKPVTPAPAPQVKVVTSQAAVAAVVDDQAIAALVDSEMAAQKAEVQALQAKIVTLEQALEEQEVAASKQREADALVQILQLMLQAAKQLASGGSAYSFFVEIAQKENLLTRIQDFPTELLEAALQERLSPGQVIKTKELITAILEREYELQAED